MNIIFMEKLTLICYWNKINDILHNIRFEKNNFYCHVKFTLIAPNDWLAGAIRLFAYKNLPFTICCDIPNEIYANAGHNKY